MNAQNLLARPFRPARDQEPADTAGAQPAGLADPEEAQDFLRQFHTEHPDQPVPFALRLRQVRRAIQDTGSYRHTPAELAFGARVAWRNSARCIGRLYWRGLRVLDRRDAGTAAEIHRHLVDHLRQATNGGRIRPVISVFAPRTPHAEAPLVWNSQLIRYAGYRRPDGAVLGDPAQTGFTEAVRALGWRPPGGGGPFDVLPLVIQTPGERPALFELDRAELLEVALRHPRCPAFAELGLRWHAVPAISHMRLRIGGIDYPLAPFNGWYMGTEIGARTLTDTDRYDLLPRIAAVLGLDTSSEDTLWRDRALVEVNIAVLHSFRAAGVTITDHHTESRRFLTHLEREESRGRTVPADWSWIVPPLSGGITPVFHRYYDTAEQRPNFYLDPDARARSEGGEGGDGRAGGGCPVAH
jgi:nitric-oxide synthase